MKAKMTTEICKNCGLTKSQHYHRVKKQGNYSPGYDRYMCTRIGSKKYEPQSPKDAKKDVGTLSNPLPVKQRTETKKTLQLERSGSGVGDTQHPADTNHRGTDSGTRVKQKESRPDVQDCICGFERKTANNRNNVHRYDCPLYRASVEASSEDVLTTCGECGKWKSRDNIILCGACYTIIKQQIEEEAKKQAYAEVFKELDDLIKETHKRCGCDFCNWLDILKGRLKKLMESEK